MIRVVRHVSLGLLLVVLFVIPACTMDTSRFLLPFFGVSCKWPIYTEVNPNGVKMSYFDKNCKKEPISVADFNKQIEEEQRLRLQKERENLRERAGL